MCYLHDFDHLRLLPAYRQTLERELDLWHRAYLPAGRTVLDLGAGCGETAQFYLSHGSELVLAVESDEKALECLRENFKDNKHVIILPYHVDKIKVDIEGAEKDMVLETHFPFKWKKDRLSSWPRSVSLWRLEEHWGSIPRRAVRKILKR